MWESKHDDVNVARVYSLSGDVACEKWSADISLHIIGFTVRPMPICLDKAAASYLVNIKAFIVALMQYTADEQDLQWTHTREAQPQRSNGSKNGWRHAVLNFTCCIYPQLHSSKYLISCFAKRLIKNLTAADRSQLQLYDWHSDEFSDVPPLIRPTIYE